MCVRSEYVSRANTIIRIYILDECCQTVDFPPSNTVPFDMSSALENQKQLAKTFIEVEATWESDKILSLRTEDCLYEIFPKTVGYPVMDSKATKEFYDQLKPLWSNYKVMKSTFAIRR